MLLPGLMPVLAVFSFFSVLMGSLLAHLVMVLLAVLVFFAVPDVPLLSVLLVMLRIAHASSSPGEVSLQPDQETAYPRGLFQLIQSKPHACGAHRIPAALFASPIALSNISVVSTPVFVL